ncbi:MAG TPA: VRR-NUC domain-containing protein [Ktedonobacterales bacterium]|jgi:hypothetical protein|nr:VRR-NUC domain-containing protein [Ktedonobacterales bacterium]
MSAEQPVVALVAPPAQGEREAAFQAAVIELAQLTGWLVYHTHDARRSAPGWPDLALCKPPRLLLIELKTTHGRLRPEQLVWLTALAGCAGIEAAVWRPADWPTIERALVSGERLSDGLDDRAPASA